MLVRTSIEDSRVRFCFEPENGDGRNDFDSASIANLEFYCDLPNECDTRPHNDHIALASLLAVAPFVSSKIVLDVPVSENFLIACSRFGFDVSTSNADVVEPYSCANGKPALAFSGGVDSTAALALMPDSTISVFLDRPLNRGRTLYKKEAALYAVNHLQSIERQAYLVECDVEYVRKPVGFPVDTEMDLPSTAAIPAILAADGLGLDAIAFGVIAESAYKLGHDKFADFASSEHYLLWGGLFRAAGLPYMAVTAGISEVGTSAICLSADIGHIAQSCMRGGIQKPCMNCMKCFRKTLLEKAILKELISESDLNKLIQSKEVIRNLVKTPIKHENVFKYILGRDIGEGRFLSEFKYRVLGDEKSISYEWLEKWYAPSIELVPAKYQEEVELRIESYLSRMTSEEIEFVQSWDQREAIVSGETKERSESFVEYLKAAGKTPSVKVDKVAEPASTCCSKPAADSRMYDFLRKVKRKLKYWVGLTRGRPSKSNELTPRVVKVKKPSLKELASLLVAGNEEKLHEQMGLADPRVVKALALGRANLSLEKSDVSGWLKSTNEYLSQFELAPIEFRSGAGSQFSRLASSGGVKLSGGRKVSVIVPAFNAEETIQLSVGSLLAQTYSNIEVIVVDDCSSDSTREILEKLSAKDDRLKVVVGAENRGPYVSKNIALKYCTGDFITGHDADDWAHPQRIEKQLAFMVANPNIQVGIASMLRVTEECHFSKMSDISEHSYDGALRTAMISAFFKREAIEVHLGGWDSVRFAGDSEMIGRAKIIFGSRVKYFPMMTMICLDSPTGLTNDPLTGVNTTSGMSASRKIYSSNYREFHRLIAADHGLAKYRYPMDSRPFPAPDECVVW